ncbi:MAG: VWA domain-containing protein, partial [Gammaproteobacteria bacterium]
MWPEVLAEFHFLRPYWLLGLIPLAVLVFSLWRNQKSANAWGQMIDEHLLKHLLIAQQKVNKAKIHNGWFVLSALLAIVALAGPTFEKRPLPVFETELSKVVILDLSLSMNATDIKPSRLARAKFKINDILTATKEGQIALIVYAGDAFVISPLTTDAKTIATLVPPLAPELMPVLGSEPFKAFELASELFANAGVFSGQIIWITDGLDDDDYRETQAFMAQTSHQISILAVGTSEGSPIPLADGQGFLKNSNGEIVVPSLNYAVLQSLAQENN